MYAIGIDSCVIARFSSWKKYNKKTLRRIYSEQEIQYCLANSNVSLQRFAVRFAAREALFKSLFHINTKHTVPFLTLCKATTIKNNGNAPIMKVNWNLLEQYSLFKKNYTTICSFTHTKQLATAIVCII